MSCWLLPSAQGACGALCCRSAAARLGRAAPTRSPTSARRVRPHRRLPRRRTLHYALAGTVFGPAGPPLAPGADPAATAVPQTPLPARLPEPVPRGRRLDLLAAVLPHRLGPARAAPDHPGPSWCAAPAPRRLSNSTTRCWQSWPATRVLRCRKLRMDTTVVEADIDHPTDADLLEHAVRTLGGLVRRVQAARRGHPYPVPRPLPRRRPAALADLPDPAAAHRAGARRDRPAHRAGRPGRPAHPGPGRADRPQRPPGACQAARRWPPATADPPAGGDRCRNSSAAGPDPPATARHQGDPRPADVTLRPGRPPDPQGQAAQADRVRLHRAAGRV